METTVQIPSNQVMTEKPDMETKLVILVTADRGEMVPYQEIFEVPKDVPCGVRYVIDKTIQSRGENGSFEVSDWIEADVDDSSDKFDDMDDFYNQMESKENREKYLDYFMKLDFEDFTSDGVYSFSEVEPKRLL